MLLKQAGAGWSRLEGNKLEWKQITVVDTSRRYLHLNRSVTTNVCSWSVCYFSHDLVVCCFRDHSRQDPMQHGNVFIVTVTVSVLLNWGELHDSKFQQKKTVAVCYKEYTFGGAKRILWECQKILFFLTYYFSSHFRGFSDL